MGCHVSHYYLKHIIILKDDPSFDTISSCWCGVQGGLKNREKPICTYVGAMFEELLSFFSVLLRSVVVLGTGFGVLFVMGFVGFGGRRGRRREVR